MRCRTHFGPTRMTGLIYMFMFFFLHSMTLAKNCPPPENLAPCQCDDQTAHPNLICTGGDIDKLRNVFQYFNDVPINRLVIQNVILPFIPVLDLTKVTELEIYSSVLDDIFGEYYNGAVVDSLTSITFENITFRPMTFSPYLLTLKKLNNLVVRRSRFSFKQLDMSDVLLPISQLVFVDDGFEDLSSTAFGQLYSLDTLVLKSNRLSKFTRKMLPHKYSRLVHLDLSFNRLSAFPDDIFDGMPLLIVVDLKGNNFKTLNSTYMEKIWEKLHLFDATGNPIVCDCDMAWIASKVKPEVVSGECASPQPLKGKKLADLTKDDFKNCPV